MAPSTISFSRTSRVSLILDIMSTPRTTCPTGIDHTLNNKRSSDSARLVMGLLLDGRSCRRLAEVRDHLLTGEAEVIDATSKAIKREDIYRAAEKLSNWGRWGKDDQIGTLNN